MGRKSVNKWVYILPEATLSYRESDINRFIEMWNDGQSISAIAEKFVVKKYEIGLLIMHCELEGLIGPREGGLRGTKKHKWEQHGKGKKDESIRIV